MFFTEKEERNNTLQPNKYNELSDKFNSCVATSLEGINPIALSWSTSDLNKPRLLSFEMHPTYIETLDDIEQCINEIKFERRFRNRLSPTEKEKVIDAFLIPLYEHKKIIYVDTINYMLECVTKLLQQPHSHEYKKEMRSKCLLAMEEYHRQIKACDESIHDYKPAGCVSYCAIL